MKKILAVTLAAAAALVATDSRASGSPSTFEVDAVPATATLSATSAVQSFTINWTHQQLDCGTFDNTKFAPISGSSPADFQVASGTPCPNLGGAATAGIIAGTAIAAQALNISVNDVATGADHVVTLTDSLGTHSFALALDATVDGQSVAIGGFVNTNSDSTHTFAVTGSLAADLVHSSHPDGAYTGSFDVTFSR